MTTPGPAASHPLESDRNYDKQNTPIMKTTLLLALVTMAPSALVAQTIINSDSFFDPNFNIRRNGSASFVALTVTNTAVSGTQSNATNSWTHSAGGHAQVRVAVPLLANIDAQLAAYTRTTGDTLVFGREITTDVEVLGGGNVGPTLQGLVNQVAGASVIYDWDSDATISGLAIAPNQLYRVDFTVQSASGLPVNLLSSSTFGITSAGISGANNNDTSTLLNLLGLITVGSGADSENVSFYFTSDQARTSLDFNFAATSGVGVSLLGGTALNQNVLSFSGFSVTAVPEPSSLALCGAFVSVLGLRRRRQA